MSKYNNVNPGSYKIGGREHTEGSDKGDAHTDQKVLLANSKEHDEAPNAPAVPGARQSKKK
ncbi:MAG: hypothetical protein QOI24_1889 [Acidobacteriota bacterium]|jgi:hypothetical protein|nr:hypothetical protein [Acidobacteriota bacterium]